MQMVYFLDKDSVKSKAGNRRIGPVKRWYAHLTVNTRTKKNISL